MRGNSRTVALAITALLGLGCEWIRLREKTGPRDEPKKSTLGQQQGPDASAKTEIADSTEVAAFLAEWVKVQNQGRFDAYAAFYAKEFTGAKLAGSRSSYFGRAGWLEDRKRMFERPFSVRVAGVRTEFLERTIILSFVQTWENATFHDRGEKRLQLVREDGQLRISREAMLNSERPGSVAPQELKFEQGAVATRTRAGHALLIPGKVDIGWATDHPVYLSDTTGERSVAEWALPSEVRKLKAQRYEVFDKSGVRCVAEPIGFKIHIGVVPPYWLTEEWNGRADARQGQAVVQQGPTPQAQRALALWRMASSSGMQSPEGVPMGLSLALELQYLDACRDIAWGRKLVDGFTKDWTLRRVTKAELSAMRSAARTHPLGVHAERHRTKASNEAVWISNLTQQSARVAERSNVELFFLMDILGPDTECGESIITVVWRKHGNGLIPLLHELPRPFLGHRGEIWDAADLDGDGRVEFITETTIIGEGQHGYETLVDHTPELLGCWC
jgi:hypothetical protein